MCRAKRNAQSLYFAYLAQPNPAGEVYGRGCGVQHAPREYFVAYVLSDFLMLAYTRPDNDREFGFSPSAWHENGSSAMNTTHWEKYFKAQHEEEDEPKGEAELYTRRHQNEKTTPAIVEKRGRGIVFFHG